MLIGLHGKKQAGKDTVYGRIERLLGPGSATGATVERASFMDAMYRVAAATLDVTVAELQRWKNDPTVRVQVRRVSTFHASVTDQSVTVRQYLQNFGAEHRAAFGEGFWVERANLAHARKLLVVTDVRMPAEGQAILDAGGSVVHVVGPPEVEGAGDEHATEKPLPGWMIDYTLDNSVRDDDFKALDDTVLELVLAMLREGRA